MDNFLVFFPFGIISNVLQNARKWLQEDGTSTASRQGRWPGEVQADDAWVGIELVFSTSSVCGLISLPKTKLCIDISSATLVHLFASSTVCLSIFVHPLRLLRVAADWSSLLFKAVVWFRCSACRLWREGERERERDRDVQHHVRDVRTWITNGLIIMGFAGKSSSNVCSEHEHDPFPGRRPMKCGNSEMSIRSGSHSEYVIWLYLIYLFNT